MPPWFQHKATFKVTLPSYGWWVAKNTSNISLQFHLVYLFKSKSTISGLFKADIFIICRSLRIRTTNIFNIQLQLFVNIVYAIK